MFRFVFFFCISLIFTFPVQAAPDAYSREWLHLLHYKTTLFGGYEGLMNNPGFYVAKDGRYDPEAEMDAEIQTFNIADNKQKCEFPARFNWLKEKGVVQGNLDDCEEYQSFLNDVQPDGVTVLFTNAFMSNPASLFGHTLVRIDTKRKGTQMLAHGSNFGANSGPESGFFFAMKGLFGFYQGAYSYSPYWDIINTYNNIENRDIWEYHLNLTDEEKYKFINHLYEMKNAGVRYFFLSKNCSYMLLELLEAVRPDLELTKNYNYWAIPLDTLKTIKNVPDLVDDVHYRPARYTKIKAQLKDMNEAQYQAFLKAIKQHDYDMSELSESEQSEVLEAAYQYYQYQYIAKKMELKEYRKNSFAVLRKRSQMPAAAEKQLEGEDPSLSHASAQIAVKSGIYNQKSFEEFMIRPAYTVLTDDSWGIIKGAGVQVLESRWRYYNQNHKLVLQEFIPLKVSSLVPSDRVFQPLSYMTDTAIKREYNPQTQKEGYVADLGVGIGQTYALLERFWIYGIMRVNGQYGGFIKDNYWLGATPEVGIFSDLGRVRLHSAVKQTWATQKFGDRLMFKNTVSFGITRDLSFNLSYDSSHNRGGHNQEEYAAQIYYAF